MCFGQTRTTFLERYLLCAKITHRLQDEIEPNYDRHE